MTLLLKIKVVAHWNELPLRLSFEPQAIREHFEGDAPWDEVLATLTDGELAAIAADLLDADTPYQTFHELLKYGIKQHVRNKLLDAEE